MDWTLIIQATAAAVAGLAVIALALAVLLLARHNRGLSADIRRLVDQDIALLETAGQQAEAVRALTEETHQDHTIATQPLLVLLDEPPIGIREQPWAAVRVRNVGNGPALHFVVWMLAGGSLYRSAGAEVQGFSGTLHLASRDIFEPGPFQNMLYVGKTHGYLDPGPAVVGEHPDANLAAYCGDQFGNRYRFNLRTADPPEVWERGTDAPSWAGAWDPRLSSGAWSKRDAPTVMTPLHERDTTLLVEALHQALHALEDADAAEGDGHITGHAGTTSHPH
jgi:hypothetical protein